METLELQADTDTSRLSDSVYTALVEGILAGKLTPGTVLSELALSKQLRVSRTPVHDALKQLAKDGLVEQQANRRAVIAVFTAEDVHDIFEMRKLLEGEAARRASTRLDRATLSGLRDGANKIAADFEKNGWADRWADYDEKFHRTIAEFCGSKRLSQDIARYRLFHRILNRTSITPEVVNQALAEHYQILDALEQRDPKAAAQRMIAHIYEWQAYFVNRMPK